MQLHTFPDQQTLAAALRTDIAQHGQASLAVSGGSTPAPLFERLSALDLPWRQVLITLAASPEANEALVRTACSRTGQRRPPQRH